MSELIDLLRRRIALAGPISVAEYMSECLGHPQHGYYMTRDPFGAAGDFTTSPEVSQMFGELLGAWSVVVWQCMGRPEKFVLAELGPGRGTLMVDVLRATRTVPGFHAALQPVLVETSPVLRAAQQKSLAVSGVTARWVDTVAEVPDGPLILLANEFFDALPIRQFLFGPDLLWRERLIGVEAETDKLGFTLSRPVPLPVAAAPADPQPGAVFEVNAAALSIAAHIGARLGEQGGAALWIDYGHERSGFADTLQGVRDHGYASVLTDPGQVDLTAHVDFQALGDAARAAGATVHAPVQQGRFLTGLGLAARAEQLMRSADVLRAKQVGDAAQRLAAPEAMGKIFKCLCVTAPGLPVPPGFADFEGENGHDR